MDSPHETTDNYIGKRIYSDSHFGTVLYTGEVETTKGFWLGVDWDDANRGKHNGSYQGKQYFQTKFPTSGSFVRLEKVQFGYTFSKVFKEFVDINEGQDLGTPMLTNTLKPIELIGFDLERRKKNFSTLLEITMNNKLISSAGDLTGISQYTPLVHILDLSANLLNSWHEVGLIFSALPKLKSLNLRENKLQVPSDPALLTPNFELLEKLILNQTNYSWQQILDCSVMWPNLLHLETWMCNITSLSPLNNCLQKLNYLNLSSNSISKWSEICFLGELEHLESLFIDSIGLEEINFPQTAVNAITPFFPALKMLSLTDNKLSKWRDVAELAKLAKLEDLRINHNPIWKLELAANSEQIVIAKLSELKCLNKMIIMGKERRGAELDYLKRYCHDWLNKGGNRDLDKNNPSIEFQEEHPSYNHLLTLHGPSEEGEIAKGSQSLKSSLICIDIEIPKTNKLLSKKLLPTMTVGKLKVLIRNIFHISPQNLKLTYVDSKNSNIEVDIDKDLRQLSYYSLSSGDKILVDW